MITANIDVMDRLVNGVIRTLRCIQRLRSIDTHINDCQAPGTSCDCDMAQQNKITLWFEFAQSSVGTQDRVNYRPHVLSKPSELLQFWVPIRQHIVKMTLSKTVRCKPDCSPLYRLAQSTSTSRRVAC
jgi:hypothetical protein